MAGIIIAGGVVAGLLSQGVIGSPVVAGVVAIHRRLRRSGVWAMVGGVTRVDLPVGCREALVEMVVGMVVEEVGHVLVQVEVEADWGRIPIASSAVKLWVGVQGRVVGRIRGRT